MKSNQGEMQLQGTGRAVGDSGLNDEKEQSGEKTEAKKSAEKEKRTKTCKKLKLTECVRVIVETS